MLREQKKDGRRRAILHAAEVLIRENGSIDFTMRELGQRAGFSTATTYNLIGSKSTVLYMLLNQSLDRVDTARMTLPNDADPIEHVFQAADTAVNIYTADASFYRPLQRFLLSMSDEVHRPRYMGRAFTYWYDVVKSLQLRDLFPASLCPEDIARELQLSFAGVITLWVHDELDTREFRAQIRTNVALTLLALDHEKSKKRLLAEIAENRKIIVPTLPAFE